MREWLVREVAQVFNTISTHPVPQNPVPHLVAMRPSSSSLRLLLRRPPLGLDAAAAAAEWRDLRERIGLMNILDILDASLNTQLF